ncbi:protein of unknown function [Tenacibaculum aestuariivivum]
MSKCYNQAYFFGACIIRIVVLNTLFTTKKDLDFIRSLSLKIIKL